MVKGSLPWGTYPPRPENLFWAGTGLLQSRKTYLFFFFPHLNPDSMTWMEVWVEPGWELSHQRALCPLSQLKSRGE